ncbi:glutaredoxin family protein [bacterium]|jgi:glutaredoxin 3|nr:glutaredoxin family protein [bacterium]
MTNSPVAIYSTPTCHFCGMTKEFFKEHNVEYVEHNVAADVEKRKEMIEKSGQMGVPVITIGENVIVGYDEEELRRLLSL